MHCKRIIYMPQHLFAIVDQIVGFRSFGSRKGHAIKKNDPNANARQCWGNACFRSFGSLILIKKIKDFDIRVNTYKTMLCGQRRIPRRFLYDDKMTQMTQSFKASARAWPWLLGHLGHAKTMTQMTQSMRAAWPCWRQPCGQNDLMQHDPNDPQ